jgi:hypothetical protein
VTWVVWNLVLVYLETMLVSVKVRCTVCNEHTIGIEIILDALDGTPRLQGSSGSSVLKDWCTVCVERTVGSKIVVEAPDGTSR